MLLDNLLQHIPYLSIHLIYQFFGILDILTDTLCHQLPHDKRLKQFNRHLLGQTALVDLQLRPHHDNGTAGIVHTLPQQILTETARFTFQHIGQGFQRPVAGACDRTTSPAVVDQGIHGLLQHPLLVADNDIRRSQLQQSLQTIISVDDPPVQIIQIRGGETSSVQLHHRPDIRRNHRDYIHDHPIGHVPGLPESFYYLQPLNNTSTFLAGRILQPSPQFLGFLVQFNGLQQLFDGFRSHSNTEFISVGLSGILVFFFRQDLLVIQSGLTGIQYNIRRKIEYLFQYPG